MKAPLKKYVYIGNCVGGIGREISEMVDRSREITRATFLKYTGNIDEFEEGLGYVIGKRKGLKMAKDWHVRYSKSIYQDKPCVYITHSAIKYIFVQQ